MIIQKINSTCYFQKPQKMNIFKMSIPKYNFDFRPSLFIFPHTQFASPCSTDTIA